MMSTRRELLTSTAAALIMLNIGPAHALLQSGTSQTLPTGWQVLPLGAGGLFTGFDIAQDGSLLARSDVGGLYRFTGNITSLSDPTKKWLSLMSINSLKHSAGTGAYVPAPNTVSTAYNAVFAPSMSERIFAILPRNGGKNAQWALYVSNDAGGTWTQTGNPAGTIVTFYMNDGGSAGTWRRAANNLAVDPNNPDICYCGMRNNSPIGSGSSAGCYVAFDGQNFNPVTTDGRTVIPGPRYDPGCNGILFDRNYGTIIVGTQRRTKRIMLPVSGHGIYESLDGGQTFQATNLTPFGRTDLTVIQMQMDFNGTCYAYVTYAGSTSSARVWRYSGPGGVWEELSAHINFPWRSSGVYPTSCVLTVDQRQGHAGFVSVINNGISNGYTSVNANLGTPFNKGSNFSWIAWGGQSFGAGSWLTAPSFDCPWLNHVFNNGSGRYVDAADCRIDPVSGRCIWAGNQGAIWLFTQSDLVTPMIPNFSVSSVLHSVSTSRGTEATVAQDVIAAPGAPQPVIAAQDVGIFQSSLVPGFYPTNFFPSPSRVDCEVLEYAAADPSFYVGRVNAEVAIAPISGGAYSGYSNNYGVGESWTKYTVQPDLMWFSSVTGSILGGVLEVTGFNSVQGHGNVITTAGNNTVYNKTGRASYGSVVRQLSGNPGGAGTYRLSGNATVSGPVTFIIGPVTVGGQTVAVDHDHHVCVPASSTGGPTQQFVPVYTTNATANPCTWNFTNLPLGQWMRRAGGYAYGPTSRPFAVGYGPDVGTVWAILLNSGTAYLYRSTDSGATYSPLTKFAYNSVYNVGIYLLSVPGYPGELWVAGYFTANVSSCIYHIMGANTGSPTVSLVSSPMPNHTSQVLTMGAPQAPSGYPTFYGLFWQGSGSKVFIYEGQWSRTSMSWSLFGPTGSFADLPEKQQLVGLISLRGDWNVYKRVYGATNHAGFAVYNP